MKWKDSDEQHDVFLRRDDQLCQKWLKEVMDEPVVPAAIQFTHSTLPPEEHISFLDIHPNLKGVISIDKLVHKSISDEEHLIVSVVAEDGTAVDEDAVNRIMELPSTVICDCPQEITELIAVKQTLIQAQKDEIAERNKQYFMVEVDKLEAYTEDLKEGLQKYLKTTRKAIAEKKKETRALKDSGTLAEMVAVQEEKNRLESELKRKQRELYNEEDRLECERDAFLEDIRQRLNGEVETQTIMTFSFEIV